MVETAGVAQQELSEREAKEVRELAKAIESVMGLKPKYADAGFGEYRDWAKSSFTADVTPSLYEGELASGETPESWVSIDRFAGNRQYPALKRIMLQDRVRGRHNVVTGGDVDWTMFITVPEAESEKPSIRLMGCLEGQLGANPQAQIGFFKKFVNAL